jgi:hypothetical protein
MKTWNVLPDMQQEMAGKKYSSFRPHDNKSATIDTFQDNTSTTDWMEAAHLTIHQLAAAKPWARQGQTALQKLSPHLGVKPIRQIFVLP